MAISSTHKTIYAPLSFRHKGITGQSIRAYLLIDCDGASGFQALAFQEIESPTGAIVCRQFELCEKHSPLATAERAYAKAVSEILDPDSIVHGEQPFDGPYRDAQVVTATFLEACEAKRAEQLDITGVVDPRKAKAAELRAQAAEREKIEQQNGFAVAVKDRNARWSETRIRRVQIEKTGGTVTVTSIIGDKATALVTDSHRDVNVRIAHELGGNFALEGFFDDNGVFVITNETLNDVIAKRLGRARPTVVRRAHTYTTPTERFAAVKKLLDTTQTELTHLRVTSTAKGAERYQNVIFDQAKMAGVVESLPPTLRESIDNAHSHAAL